MAGYAQNPLSKKLGLKEGLNVKLINAPTGYVLLIDDIINKLCIANDVGSNLDFIQFFTNSELDLIRLLPVLKEQIKKSGVIWISWYKKSAKKETELTEDIIRNIALSNGLVDVKVC